MGNGPLSLFFCRNLIAIAQQVMLHREERRSGARGDTDLSVDVLDVVMDGALRESEPFSHLAVGVAASDQPEDFDFAVGEFRDP